MTRSRMRGAALGLAGLVLVLDQITKSFALDALTEPARGYVITPFLNFVPVWNRGVSFGLLSSDSPWGPWLLAGLSLVIVTVLAVWLRRITDQPLTALGIGMAIGGALGNVIDRVRFGAVFDFIDVHAAGWHFPAFNIADAGITLGVGLMLLDALLTPQRSVK